MTDDDAPTPPRGNSKLWGDTQRSSSAAQRRDRDRAARAARDREPITDTVLLVDREEMSNAEIEIVRRSKRDSDDPATFRDVVKLAVQQSRRLERLESRVKTLNYVGGLILTFALGSAIWTVERIWSFAQLVGAMTVRMQHVEEAGQRTWQEIRDVRSRKDTP